MRSFDDRGRIIGAVARIFQDHAVGMRKLGCGFAPIRVDSACGSIGALD
jgi:hypothetical protein